MTAPSSRDRETVDAPSSARRGDVLGGRYELVSLLGSGGMGEVWRARHTVIGKALAVKVLRLSASSSRARLLQEARVLAAVQHEALVQVFDYGEAPDGNPYFVMELLEGESLATRLDAVGRLSAHEAVALAIAMGGGLGAAHAAGVIHRDVKPDNVLLVAGTGGLRPKLIDFGVALARGADGSRLTVTGTVLGTPEYMAPEVIRGDDPTPSADVWGLAITIYEMLTGTSPFRAREMVTIFKRVLEDPVPYPREPGSIDAGLWRILTEALRKDVASRTPTVEELCARLRGWAAAYADTHDGVVPVASAATRSRVPHVSSAHPIEPDEPRLAAPLTLDDVIRKKLGREG